MSTITLQNLKFQDSWKTQRLKFHDSEQQFLVEITFKSWKSKIIKKKQEVNDDLSICDLISSLKSDPIQV